MEKNKQKIVTIGGGSGSFMVLSGLKKHPVDLSAVVAMSDDGGSTGVLRDELGVLPPGDVRQCLVALSQDSNVLRDLFNYRFGDGCLNGHSFGNIFLSAMEKITGSFDKAVVEASRILRIKGYVFPVTFSNTRLVAFSKNNEEIIGEKNIYKHKDGFSQTKKLYLQPHAKLNPKIINAIEEADKIVISPGSLYSSLIPNFLVNGLSNAIKKSKAKIIIVVNLMNKAGQTDGFGAKDYVLELEKYLGKGVIKFAIVNTEKPDNLLLKKYSELGEEIVSKEKSTMSGITIIEKKLLSHKIYKANKNDKLANERSVIRHDSDKLAKVIIDL